MTQPLIPQDTEQAIRHLFPQDADFLLTALESISELSVRARNCCRHSGLKICFDLLQYSPRDLLDIRRRGHRLFGPKTVAELERFMRAQGHPLKPSLQHLEA